MDKFTTKQLQTALMTLRGKAGDASRAAYEMTFSEINRRMGDDAFDAWLDTWYS